MNTDLNDEGRRQAVLFYDAYNNVPFDKIYISELKRTQQSVQPFIDLGIPYEKLAGLDELGWGIHEGQSCNTREQSRIFADHAPIGWMGNWMKNLKAARAPTK